MPRRTKALFLVAMVFTIGMLVYTSHLRQTRPQDTRTIQDFYHKTKEALDRSRGGHIVADPPSGKIEGQISVDRDADGDVDEDDEIVAMEMADRLKAAEQKAKDLANAKSPNKPDAPSSVVGVGSSAGGQGKKASSGPTADRETEEEHAVEQEMDRILKKSPRTSWTPASSGRKRHGEGELVASANAPLQSSSSPSLIVLTPREQRASFSRNTPLSQHHTSSSSTPTPSDHRYRRGWAK